MVRNHAALLYTDKGKPIKSMIAYKQSNMTTTHGLGEAGYDIRIKQDVTFYRFLGLVPMVKIVDKDAGVTQYRLGRFTLASAIEEFDMTDDLVGIVHDKSTWARKALSVFNTVIEPGWKGYLTLELVYHGRSKLHIPAGSGIAQVLFHELVRKRTYVGRYQNQENKPVAAKAAN